MTAKFQRHPDPWSHTHVFGQDARRPGELRTVAVIALTGLMMFVEIAAGVMYGSMALLADGLHMASHAVALGISAFAYIHARKHAGDSRYSFGTGKVNALGGFTGAVLLAAFAVAMTWESVHRMIAPVEIAFNQAIAVAVIGLLVNGGSMLILGRHDEGPAGAHAPLTKSHEPGRDRDAKPHDHRHQHHDHNLRAAYLHVVADALTSFLAIFALLAGKFYGQRWVDPTMGVVGGILVSRWSIGLARSTSSVLLDHQAPATVLDRIRQSIESATGHRVTDLHVWMIGPSIRAAEIVIVANAPHTPEVYKQLLPRELGLVHINLEIHSDAEPPD